MHCLLCMVSLSRCKRGNQTLPSFSCGLRCSMRGVPNEVHMTNFAYDIQILSTILSARLCMCGADSGCGAPASGPGHGCMTVLAAGCKEVGSGVRVMGSVRWSAPHELCHGCMAAQSAAGRWPQGEYVRVLEGFWKGRVVLQGHGVGWWHVSGVVYVVHIVHLGTTCLASRRHGVPACSAFWCAWQLCFQAAVGGVCKPERWSSTLVRSTVEKAQECCACICPFAGGARFCARSILCAQQASHES